MSIEVSGFDAPRMSPREKKVQQEEREAAKKIADYQKRVRDAQLESSAAIDNIKDEFVRTSTTEELRQQTLLDNDRNRYQVAQRELEKQSNQDLQRAKFSGEADVKKTQYFYEDKLAEVEKKADQKLHEIETNSQTQSNYEFKKGQTEAELLKQAQEARTQALHSQLDDRYETAKGEYEAHHEKRMQTAAKADEVRQTTYQKNFEDKLKQQQAEVQNMETRAARTLRTIQKDTSQKIAAYGDRQNDPFYQLMTIGARLTENADSYVLQATIPSHEQKNVSISMQGNNLVIKGSRRNEEETQTTDGKKTGSASFQSYHESFSLDYPVDSHRISRVFDGDELTVMLPKKGRPGAPMHRSPYEASATQEKARFPENLPKPTPIQTSSPGDGPLTPG